MDLSNYLSSTKLVNAVLLKVAWVACVIGGNLYGFAVVLAILGMSIYQRSFAQDWPFALGLGLFGLVLDSAWMLFGVLDYGASAGPAFAGISLAPAWIVLLWITVGFSLNHGLTFFVDRPLLGALIVGVSAPFSYMAGESFGAVVIPSYENLVILGTVWVLVFYAVFTLAKNVNAEHAQKQKSAQAVPAI